MSQWHPKEDDLAQHTARGIEEAYRQRERAKCSRDDFCDGYMAALRDLRSRSSFKDGRFAPDDQADDVRAIMERHPMSSTRDRRPVD